MIAILYIKMFGLHHSDYCWVSALDFGLSSPSLNPGWALHCVLGQYTSFWSFFRLLNYSNCLNWKFTATMFYHFHIHLQFIYESFHNKSTSLRFILLVPLSTQVYTWVPGNLLLGNNSAMNYHPIRGGVEILLVISCYGNWERFRLDGPLGSNADFTYLHSTVNVTHVIAATFISLSTFLTSWLLPWVCCFAAPVVWPGHLLQHLQYL